MPLADVPLGVILRDAIRKRLDEIGVDSAVHAKDIGYELRCAKPVPFDVDYTRTLGFGAVRYLVDGGSGALIALEGGRVRPLALGGSARPADRAHPHAAGRSNDRSLSRRTRLHGLPRTGGLYRRDKTRRRSRRRRISSPQEFSSQFEPVALP